MKNGIVWQIVIGGENIVLRLSQIEVLKSLERGPLDSVEMGQKIGRSTNAAHLALRRLEDRELVRRTHTNANHAIEWELTNAGRKALNG